MSACLYLGHSPLAEFSQMEVCTEGGINSIISVLKLSLCLVCDIKDYPQINVLSFEVLGQIASIPSANLNVKVLLLHLACLFLIHLLSWLLPSDILSGLCLSSLKSSTCCNAGSHQLSQECIYATPTLSISPFKAKLETGGEVAPTSS